MMQDDVQAVADFYSSRRGRLAAGLLCRHLQAVWPDLSRLSLLGLGHTGPFLPLWRDQLDLCIDASNAPASALASALASASAPRPHWPDCLVQEDQLPFPDQSFDRVLMAHAIETASHPSRMLEAVWRALKPDGRLLMLVPNRTGLWAHSESTPFADGAPYSVGRIGRVLARSLFRIERLQGALFCPPTDLRPLLRAGPMLEAAGRFVPPNLAGLFVIEAVKDVYAALPAVASPQRVRARTFLIPAGSVPAGRSAGMGRVQASMPIPVWSSRSR